MRKKAFYGATLLVAMMMAFTSCLGDGNNQQTYSGIPGVMTFDIKTMHNVLNIGLDYPIYNSAFDDFSKFDSDGCYAVAFTLDMGLATNANVASTGFYTVSLTDYAKIDKGGSYPSVDTTNISSSEQAITSAISSGYSYTGGYFFAYSNFTYLTDQKTSWVLSYDESLSSMVKEGDKHVYDLYLRARVTTAGTTPSKDGITVNAFNIKSFVERINSAEKGNQAFYVRFNYIKSIKNEVPTWEKSDLILFPVYSTSSN